MADRRREQGAAQQRVGLASSASRAADDAGSWRPRQAIAHLQHLPEQCFDVAVISLGVNDVTAGVGVQRWMAGLRELSTLLASRFQVRQVIFSPVPPMHLLPALPQPLRGYLGSRARHFNEALARQVGELPGATLLQVDLTGCIRAQLV